MSVGKYGNRTAMFHPRAESSMREENYRDQEIDREEVSRKDGNDMLVASDGNNSCGSINQWFRLIWDRAATGEVYWRLER
jgi:hypothetical protein